MNMEDLKPLQNDEINETDTSVEHDDEKFNPYLGEIIDKSTRSNRQMMGHC